MCSFLSIRSFQNNSENCQEVEEIVWEKAGMGENVSTPAVIVWTATLREDLRKREGLF